jgi:hypothetical protein
MQRSDGPVPSRPVAGEPSDLSNLSAKESVGSRCMESFLHFIQTLYMFMHVYSLPGHRIFLLIKHVVSQPSFGSFCTSRKFFHSSYFKWNYMFVFISISPLTMTTNESWFRLLVFISIVRIQFVTEFWDFVGPGLLSQLIKGYVLLCFWLKINSCNSRFYLFLSYISIW